MIYFIYFIFFVFLLLWSAFLAAPGGVGRNVLNPGFLFSLVYGGGFFLLPCFSLYFGVYRFSDEYSFETYLQAGVFCFVFGLMVLGGYVLFSGQRSYLRWQRSDFSCYRPLSVLQIWVVVIVSGALVLAGAVPYFLLIMKYGASGYAANRIVLVQGLGYFALLLNAGLVGAVIVAANIMLRVGKVRFSEKIAFLMVLGIAMLPGVLLFSRMRFLLPFVILAVLWVMLKKRGVLRVKTIVRMTGAAVSFLLLGLMLGSVRESFMADRALDNSTIDISQNVVTTYGNQEILLWLSSNDHDFLLGKTFFAAALGMVPRSFWPGKPLGGGPALRNMIYPGSYDLEGGANLTSYTTGLPVESYMNFGWFGVFVGLLFGAGLAAIARLLLWAKSPIALGVLAVILFHSVFICYSEFFGWLVHVYSAVVPAMFLWMLLSLLRPSGLNNKI
ncbi:O-antigen polymerase [Pseudomonas sp. BN411]|uniref:O-antigen polymerase n=1 Tax=Pseudomonas sp. BN411 TaxID=2567887 RepID=UPI00245422DD|nr:O-antigen polymerase [Pseudomonas sp. BN411]